MEKSRGRLRLFLFLLAASLLPQVSFGSTLELIPGRDNDVVGLVCSPPLIGSTQRAATFTFTDPSDGSTEQRHSSTGRLDISVSSDNETAVSCRIDESTDSESFFIAGRPRFTRKPDIVQYLFPNSTDVVNFSCPLNEPGQLFGRSSFTPYEYFWRLRIREGNPTLQSNDTFELSDNSRELQVHLPTPRPLNQYRFECHARVQRCTERINSCGAISTTDTTLYPSPSGFQVKIVDLNITVTSNLPTASVAQNEQASFTCVPAGLGNFDIKWEVDGMLYDKEVCGDMDNCTVTDTNETSTLELNTEDIPPYTTLTIVCVVNQTLPDKASLENDMTEVILPNTISRTGRSKIVQLKVSPATTYIPTTLSAGSISTSGPQGPDTSALVITVVSIVFAFLLLLIIILAFCVVCIFRYHYKKYDSNFGQKLRRTFSRDPNAMGIRYTHRPSPTREIEPGLIQGTDTPPMIYTDTGADVVNSNHLVGKDQGQIYNASQNSGVSSYSGLSGVSQNNGPHRMPHYKEPSVLYVEGTSTLLPPPSGCNLSADRRSNGSRRPSDTSGSIHSGHHSLGHYPPQQHFQQPYIPSAIHGSHNVIHHQHQHSGGGLESASLSRIPYLTYATPPHVAIDIHQQQLMADPHSSLPIVAGHTYSSHHSSQTGIPERAPSMHSSHSNNSHRSSGRQSPSSYVQAVPYGMHAVPAPSRFISDDDLATVELALMHNKNCQIPNCCCYRVREIFEKRNRPGAPYESPEMSSISGSSASGHVISSVHHQQRLHGQVSSTDSDSDYSSGNDKKLRPYNLRLLSEEHNRNPNLHPHYHLTAKSHLRRVCREATVDHRRSKSLSDLTPLTEVSESTTPKTPAVGGLIKPGTPVYDRQPPLGEATAEEATGGDDLSYPHGHPALLREISISADNIPALCLNDCPFTPSPLKEGVQRTLAQSPGRFKRRGGSFRRGSMKSAQPALKTVKEKTSSVESDESNTSSRPDTPHKSSLSDDDGIVADIKQEPTKPVELKPEPRRFVAEEVQSSSLTAETYHESTSDSEVREILQNVSPSKDLHKPRPSYSPLLNRRNDSSSLSYLSSSSNAIMDPRMRRSVSPLSMGSQVSTHSRRSASPYETEVRKQNGVVTEITEC